MSTTSRIELKDMLDSWKAFDGAIIASEKALSAKTVENYSNLSQLVHKNFFEFDKDYRNYKNDTIEQSVNSEKMFNEVLIDDQTEEVVPTFPYNDDWWESQMTRYSDIMEYIED